MYLHILQTYTHRSCSNIYIYMSHKYYRIYASNSYSNKAVNIFKHRKKKKLFLTHYNGIKLCFVFRVAGLVGGTIFISSKGYPETYAQNEFSSISPTAVKFTKKVLYKKYGIHPAVQILLELNTNRAVAETSEEVLTDPRGSSRESPLVWSECNRNYNGSANFRRIIQH